MATSQFSTASSSSSFPASSSKPNATSSAILTAPPELEQTLAMLSSHRTVLGYLLLSRTHPVTIIRSSGVVFEGEQGRKYAATVGKIVETVQSGLEDVSSGNTDVDEVRFMRIRTRRYELMLSPNDQYLLAVLHDPST